MTTTFNPEVHHRHSIRLKRYDYSGAWWYFVTICVNTNVYHACTYDNGNVGAYRIRPKNGIRPYVFGDVVDGQMVLNDAGRIAHNEWIKTPDIRSNVRLDTFIVMPNHVHAIIVITGNDNGDDSCRGVSHTPNIKNCGGVCDTPLHSPSNTLGAIVRGYKSTVTRQLMQLGFVGAIWQRNYYEHIIRQHTYQRIFNYINNNPAIWKDDKFYTE